MTAPSPDERRTKKVSKYLSLHLRHQPQRIGLVLDAQGWIEIDALLRSARAGAGRSSSESMLRP